MKWNSESPLQKIMRWNFGKDMSEKKNYIPLNPIIDELNVGN
jgi:hypothetical protein